MRYPFVAVPALLVLVGCVPQQLALNPAGQTSVCAVKAGERQSYWSEQAARRDGAFVVLAGECPPRPNSEGGGGGGGGM